MFTDVVKGQGIICPDKFGSHIIQHLRIPVTVFQIAKTYPVLAARKIIFRQRHNGVIRRYRQSPQSVELTVCRPFVAIKQRFPVIPFLTQCRLALINGVLTPGFIEMAIAITVLHVWRRGVAGRNAIDNFF
ncbi:hypothetical protein SDC9_196188 [bioreactor metagenome]|uniref:Uncharacterized protein n=1 Tax=bioreactor metagenome TaxID=1076179 RepID=A0A645IBC1_9ZZZZ